MAKVTIDPGRVDAVIFDMDGVVTDTARVHLLAWTRLFDEVLADLTVRGADAARPFTPDDYRRYVDGMSREDGVVRMLASRGITLERGSPDDGPETATVIGLSRRKNGYFLAEVARSGVRPFASTVALVRTLQSRGVGTAVISASRNARAVLESAGVLDLSPVVVDGQVAAERSLPGKPDPAIFLEAARVLGSPPARVVVVEDALAGVRAGRLGGFALVIGVDRGGAPDPLRQAGADVVVGDLAEVAVGPSPP
jgi:beta-phosphoglucomutase family hydrolase